MMSSVGWIGTGVMGASMCGHLLAAGHEVTVTSRTKAKASALLEAGARWAATPADVAAESDVVFAMVGLPSEVRAVVLGPDGALAGARAGSLLIDTSTSGPALAAEIAAVAAERGVHALDAPVTGGDVGARNGTLSIMVGGDPGAYEQALPYLEVLGSTIRHQGGPGAGQHAKLVNQILIAGTMVSLCEGLVYAHRAGLDVNEVLGSVSTGAAGSWSLSNLAPRIVAGDFAPGFMVEHFVKDLGLALAEAERLGIALPGLALAHQLYVAVRAQGHGRAGTHALIHALASLSGVEPRS